MSPQQQEPSAPQERTSPREQDEQPSAPAPVAGSPRRRQGPVVVSSLTGEPLEWPREDEEPGREARRGGSNDARLADDVPPHWGRGY